MSRLSRTFWSLVALAGPACVDTSPIDYQAPAHTRPDGGALADGGDGGTSLVTACRSCMTAGACAEAIVPCSGDTKCTTFLECALDAYCLNFPITDLSHLPECVERCRTLAGIRGATDEAAGLFAPALLCAQDPERCGDVCNVR